MLPTLRPTPDLYWNLLSRSRTKDRSAATIYYHAALRVLALLPRWPVK